MHTGVTCAHGTLAFACQIACIRASFITYVLTRDEPFEALSAFEGWSHST